MLRIIVKGKYDFAVEDGRIQMLLRVDGRLESLSGILGPYVGKTIVISLEEEEPVLNENLNALFVHEI